MKLIFDIETCGLPIFEKQKKREFPKPENLDAYNSARIVSIAWILVNENYEIIQQEYYIIKPDNFIIPEHVVKIHGISTQYAHEFGIPINNMFNRIGEALERVDSILSYNIEFDYNILKSELFRYNQNNIIEKLDKKIKKCIMLLSQQYMQMTTYPKLCDAFKYMFNENMNNAHNAMEDTINCYKVLRKINYSF